MRHLKKRDSYSLIFNIGSGSVIGSLVKVTEKAGVDILCYIKEQIPFEQDLSPEKHLANLKVATTRVGEKLHTEGVKKINHGQEKPIEISRSYYLFSNPWCTSQTKTFKIKESKPVKLSDKYINALIQKQGTTTSVEEKMIENHIVQIKVNGYVISKFENLKTREAEISFLTSFVNTEALKLIEEAIAKTFIVEENILHSSTLALYSTVRDLFPNEENFVTLDLSEEMTSLNVIKSGLMHSEATFPFGRNGFVRELAIEAKVDQLNADSMIKMNVKKAHNDLAGIKIENVLKRTTENWYQNLSQVFSHFMESLFLPQTIFFVSYLDIANPLIDKLKTAGYKVVPLIARKINAPVKIDDIMFKISLSFLDKIYKI